MSDFSAGTVFDTGSDYIRKLLPPAGHGLVCRVSRRAVSAGRVPSEVLDVKV